MGGELEIHARFPEGVFEIDQFGALPSSDDSGLAEPATATKTPTRRRSPPKKKPRRKK
jgi:hypothetical protein